MKKIVVKIDVKEVFWTSVLLLLFVVGIVVGRVVSEVIITDLRIRDALNDHKELLATESGKIRAYMNSIDALEEEIDWLQQVKYRESRCNSSLDAFFEDVISETNTLGLQIKIFSESNKEIERFFEEVEVSHEQMMAERERIESLEAEIEQRLAYGKKIQELYRRHFPSSDQYKA